MPEIIDGVTYPTTAGGRPYPTAASPGKALWQLLQRAMENLDTADASTAAQIAALSALVTASSPQRRQFYLTASTNPSQQVLTRVTGWAADAAAGDAGNPTSGGIRLASDVITLTDAGLYSITASNIYCSTNLNAYLRVNGALLGRLNDPAQGYPVAHCALTARVAAGSTVDMACYRASSSAGYFGSKTDFGAVATGSETSVSTADRSYFHETLTIVRLGS